MPPFGNLFGLPVYVDPALEADEFIFFNAGNHAQTVRMKYRDFKELVKPPSFITPYKATARDPRCAASGSQL